MVHGFPHTIYYLYMLCPLSVPGVLVVQRRGPVHVRLTVEDIAVGTKYQIFRSTYPKMSNPTQIGKQFTSAGDSTEDGPGEGVFYYALKCEGRFLESHRVDLRGNAKEFVSEEYRCLQSACCV